QRPGARIGSAAVTMATQIYRRGRMFIPVRRTPPAPAPLRTRVYSPRGARCRLSRGAVRAAGPTGGWGPQARGERPQKEPAGRGAPPNKCALQTVAGWVLS